MALEAKRAAKLEKKLKTLLGGYQVSSIFLFFEFNHRFDNLFKSRGQALVKALNDIYDQIDQTQVESKTFELLRQNEVLAIPKRIEVRLNEIYRKTKNSCLYFFLF
jgi:pre-mRNA-splicing factor CDC5/CEF1